MLVDCDKDNGIEIRLVNVQQELEFANKVGSIGKDLEYKVVYVETKKEVGSTTNATVAVVATFEAPSLKYPDSNFVPGEVSQDKTHRLQHIFGFPDQGSNLQQKDDWRLGEDNLWDLIIHDNEESSINLVEISVPTIGAPICRVKSKNYGPNLDKTKDWEHTLYIFVKDKLELYLNFIRL